MKPKMGWSTIIEVTGLEIPAGSWSVRSADNLCHVSQALSRIAGIRNSMQDRLEYVKDNPEVDGTPRRAKANRLKLAFCNHLDASRNRNGVPFSK